LGLQTTASSDNLSNPGCIINDNSSNDFVKTTNKTKNGIFSFGADGSEDEAISQIFDEITPKLNFPQTLLSLIQSGERLGHDKDLSLRELYNRYGPEMLSSETRSQDNVGLSNALLSYHQDNPRNSQDIRKENQEEVTVQGHRQSKQCNAAKQII
jgi:hypothetical protein